MNNYWLDRKKKNCDKRWKRMEISTRHGVSLIKKDDAMPPWNTSTYQGFEPNDNSDAMIIYPEIYGFKTPETDKIGGSWQNDGWGE